MVGLETTTADITAEDGAKIVAEAKSWKGTPYVLVGKASNKGAGGSADCSGSTWHIYTEAGFPYDYQPTATFRAYVEKSGRFRELKPDEPRQDGDLLYWSGHMAIYSTFKNGDLSDAITQRVNRNGQNWTQKNDMWTASRPGGAAYGPGAIQYWRPGEQPTVFRYVK